MPGGGFEPVPTAPHVVTLSRSGGWLVATTAGAIGPDTALDTLIYLPRDGVTWRDVAFP